MPTPDSSLPVPERPERLALSTSENDELRRLLEDFGNAALSENTSLVYEVGDAIHAFVSRLKAAPPAPEQPQAEGLLTFAEVATVNHARALVWHRSGLEEWSVSDWAVAMGGEAGEVLNAVKKLRRLQDAIRGAAPDHPQDIGQATAAIAQEIGDTFLYLDLLAQRLGLKIADCISETFNRVSVREGFPHRLRDVPPVAPREAAAPAEPHPTDHNALFEAKAEKFYQDTGMLAPGKDQPAAMGGSPTEEQRSRRWAEWNRKHATNFPGGRPLHDFDNRASLPSVPREPHQWSEEAITKAKDCLNVGLGDGGFAFRDRVRLTLEIAHAIDFPSALSGGGSLGEPSDDAV